MGSVGLVVLIVVLLVGLLLGGMLAWASGLLSTGHPKRRAAKGHPQEGPPARRAAPGSARSVIGAFVAIAVAFCFVVILVPASIQGLPVMVDVPGGALTLSFAVLILAVAFALPSWLGVRH